MTFREQRFRNECQGIIHMLPYSFGPIFIRFVGGFEDIPKIVLQLIDNFETTLEHSECKVMKQECTGWNVVH